MNAKEIGKKLKELRGNKSLQRVASDVGITVSALSNYEQGLRIPRDEVKIKLANYYASNIQKIFYN